jgi:hypothetical protein
MEAPPNKGRKGRKVDDSPNKVFIPTANDVVRNDDGSLEIKVPFNNDEGTRMKATVKFSVENGTVVPYVLEPATL